MAATSPPSTRTSQPETNAAASEQRNRTTAAMSSTRPGRIAPLSCYFAQTSGNLLLLNATVTPPQLSYCHSAQVHALPFVNRSLQTQADRSCCSAAIRVPYHFEIDPNTFTALDGDTAYRMQCSNLPPSSTAVPCAEWLLFDNITLTVSGMPLFVTEIGDVSVTVTATDSLGYAISDSYVLTITTSLHATINQTLAASPVSGEAIQLSAMFLATAAAELRLSFTSSLVGIGTLRTSSGTDLTVQMVGAAQWQLEGSSSDLSGSLAVAGALQYVTNNDSCGAFTLSAAISDSAGQAIASDFTLLNILLMSTVGHYCDEAVHSVRSCRAGVYGNVTGLSGNDSCNGECPAGYVCATATSIPEPCPVGHSVLRAVANQSCARRTLSATKCGWRAPIGVSDALGRMNAAKRVQLHVRSAIRAACWRAFS